MSYHGFEIFFLSLGNADSILVRHYLQGAKTNVLVDGGRQKHAESVRTFLRSLGESHIDHLVCSHHHEDHAAGLVELVKDRSLTFGRAWMHTGNLLLDRFEVGRAQAFASLYRRMVASKETQKQLIAALNTRGVSIEAPFAAKQIGPLFVASPTEQFYASQLELIRQDAIATQLNERYKSADTRAILPLLGYTAPDSEDDDEGLGGEPTSPENEISTVLLLPWTDSTNVTRYYLLTADAGTAALSDLMSRSRQFANDIVKSLKWMQVPHHGSRRNLNEQLLDYYRPETCFVSAEGSKKHPSVKLVNAIKARAGRVYSTHYPSPRPEGYWIRHHEGIVPDVGASSIPSLWE